MTRSSFEDDTSPGPIPACAGVGLRATHYRDVLENSPDMGWFEVHPENYMGDGGPPHRYLTAIRERYPLSMHGVGLSIAGQERPDPAHLQRLRELLHRYEPGLFSEHLAWSSAGTQFLNDLLPVPYDDGTLARVVEHIDAVQSFLGRQLLLENPATYLRFSDDVLTEIEFLGTVAQRSGCGLLLDVNNVHVSAVNHGFDAANYIDSFPVGHVGEIHIAGHTTDEGESSATLLIDSHNRRVAEPVWQLLARALARTGPLPVLVEWDSELPAWEVLADEARRADELLAGLHDFSSGELALAH
ncbi:MAG: DUF692 domain-containing protein [Gammaproteobacteria bacterium]|nr:DUF692 domain-containing protein [Gammaproteobacteria bacterium]